jgi:hypothetical protein
MNSFAELCANANYKEPAAFVIMISFCFA